MQSDAPDARPRWERRKDARPGEIIAAALDLFVEKGYAGTRLDDVASRAGISKGTLYLYFDNKEALFKAVVRETIVPLFAESGAAIARHTGPRAELLRAFFGEWWSRYGSTKLAGIAKIVMAEAGNFPELAAFFQREVVEASLAQYRQVLEAGVASGEFRPVDIDYAVRVMQAPLVMLSIWNQSIGRFCEPGDIDVTRFLAAHADLMVTALLAAPPQGAPAAARAGACGPAMSAAEPNPSSDTDANTEITSPACPA